jgi:hypothetical protein
VLVLRVCRNIEAQGRASCGERQVSVGRLKEQYGKKSNELKRLRVAFVEGNAETCTPALTLNTRSRAGMCAAKKTNLLRSSPSADVVCRSSAASLH